MKQRVLYLLRFYVLTVLVFVAAKPVFMFACREGHAPLAVADVWQVVGHGLTLDLSTALYFLVVPFLATVVSLWVSVPRCVLRAYTALIALAFALAFVADASLYPFWRFKLDASCLAYLSTPGEAVASVTVGYLLVRAALLAVLAAALYWCYQRLAPWPRCGRSASPLRATLLWLLAVPPMVVGIRGGVSESTTNIGQVYYSQDQYLNHSAVNPVFSFLYSLSHQLEGLEQYQFLDEAECAALLQGVYTTESVLTDTLLTTPRPNVVIILMESAGEQFAEAMPYLQRLKQEGVCFSRCYANSWRTDRGTVAVLSGYPSFPSMSVMKMPEKSRTLPSIAATLGRQGYTTSYLYGGDINFTNFRSYLFSTGWQHVVSMADYTQRQQHTAQWGVRDDITFQTLYRQITQARGRRFLMGYSTLSSHEPWDVPTTTIAHDEVLNAFAYLDNCLRDFVERLRQSPAWDDLLLVLVADHGINHGRVDLSQPQLKNHVPLLWVGGAVRAPRQVGVLCNQSDLAATLLGQMALGHADFAFSRDVLSATYRHPTAVSNYYNAQWLTDSTGHVLYDVDARRLTISHCPDSARLTRLDKAILQTTTNDLRQR